MTIDMELDGAAKLLIFNNKKIIEVVTPNLHNNKKHPKSEI